MVKIIDIPSEKQIGYLEGHKEAVSSVSPSQKDSRLLFSSSFDKTIRAWDLRQKTSISTTLTASPLWAVRSVGNHLIAGGENCSLGIYSVE